MDTFEMPSAPPKVRAVLKSLLQDSEQVLFLLKTKWKPSFTIPTLWLAFTNRRLLLMSTLSNKPVFRSASFGEINAVHSEQAGRFIRVLSADNERPDWEFYVADSVSSEIAIRCVHEINLKL